jgi:hypothetical protein
MEIDMDESSLSEIDQTPIEWFDLFSRGARDWMRHNQKVKDQAILNLPDFVLSIL